jgi:hypothetical protein
MGCPVTEVSSVQRTQQGRRLPPLTQRRKRIQFPKRCIFWFLEHRTMDKVVSVLHHRRNRLENTASLDFVSDVRDLHATP